MMQRRSDDCDNLYGVQGRNGSLMIGNFSVNFKDGNLSVDELEFPATDGLLELICMKEPNTNVASFTDWENSMQILEVRMEQGAAWIGYKLTDGADYDIENRRLCNISHPRDPRDAVNLATLENALNAQKVQLKQDFYEVQTVFDQMQMTIDNLILRIERIQNYNEDVVERALHIVTEDLENLRSELRTGTIANNLLPGVLK
ncbi:hypothetical protein QAD02_008287 [Eretmocerus hayati]|uniref:Uncharacterized protein n=1 Tax=Eretmocerus hayati TaxID=131215 RepID=A0ACC2N602_9HYME|nr:hypothetical protein QAD02_008287 [Eretmocerus hayati]